MNYLKVYIKLMRKASKQPKPKIYEKHHVFPVSIYGKNNYIIKLTPRQHYIAHALLCKIFIKRYGKKDQKSVKMIRAFWFMHSKGPLQKERYINSRFYETLKSLHKESMNGSNNPMHGVRLTGENGPMFGKTHSEETRKKISIVTSGSNNPMYGKTHSPETIKKMREAKLGEKNARFGKTHTEEARQKIRESKLGEKHHLFGKPSEEMPFFGKKHTEAAKRIMSEKRSLDNLGRKWYTNGVKNVFKKDCPKGFYPGRTYIRKKKT
jgi:hypothetical protein